MQKGTNNTMKSTKTAVHRDEWWGGAKVVTFEEAISCLDMPENIDETDYVSSMFNQDFVSIKGNQIPLGASRDDKLLVVLTDDSQYGNEAVSLVKKLVRGMLIGNSDDGDFIAIMDGANGSPHFNIYSEK